MIHTPSNIKKIKTCIYYFITWVEIDRNCNKLTDSMHRFLKRLASLYVLTNKHMSTPEETICHFPVARVAFALPNPMGTGKDGMNHCCHLAIHEIYGDKATGNELWLVARTNMVVCVQFCCILSEEFTSHSQHRHADNAPTIPMSRPNVRAHRRGIVTGCHDCETIF